MADNKVNIVNGRVVPQFMGKPMQDAKPAKPEDNEVYALEKSIVTYTKVNEEVLDKQPEPMGGGVSSWNDLTDKPFYEEKAFEPIVWDGNTEGKETVFEGNHVKVSDAFIPAEALQGASITLKAGESGGTTVPNVETMILTATEHGYMLGELVVVSDGQYEAWDGTVIAKGVWFVSYGGNYVSELVPAVNIKTLDGKFLPKALQFGDVASYDLTWDGNTDGLEYWAANKAYKVSDAVPTPDQMKKGGAFEAYIVPVKQPAGSTFVADDVTETDGVMVIGLGGDSVAWVVSADKEIDGATVSAGVYFKNDGTVYIRNLTINDYDGFKTVTTIPMDEKYLPMEAIIAAVKAAL